MSQRKKRSYWREDIKNIIELLKQGRRSAKQLRDDLKKLPSYEGVSPDALKKRVERHLKTLDYWGLAKPCDRHLWSWYTHLRTFHSRAEYEVSINHSKQVLPALEAIGKLRIGSETFIKPELLDCAKSHLKTGYPAVQKLLRDWTEKEEELGEKRGRLTHDILHRLRERFGELVEPAGLPRKLEYIGDNVPEAVYTIMQDKIKGRPSLELGCNTEERIVCGTSTVGRGSKFLSQLCEFIEAELIRTQNLDAIAEPLRIEEEKTKLLSDLQKEIHNLILRVQAGEPLEGECEICPRVKIKVPEPKQGVSGIPEKGALTVKGLVNPN